VTVRKVRCRGGNHKFRALRLDAGNFSWGSEARAPLASSPGPAACQDPPRGRGALPCPAAALLLLPLGPASAGRRQGDARAARRGGADRRRRPQAVTRKTRVLDVVYNASNNELVRGPPVLAPSKARRVLLQLHACGGCQ
jgi:hypothetical protein